MSSAVSREVLIRALRDHDPVVRVETTNLLENLGWEPGNDPETVYYLFARKNWKTFLALGAPTRVETLLNVLGRDASVFREEATTTLASLYALVDGVIFGAHQPSDQSQRFTLHNPDVADLIFPMSQLERILIATDTYDFFLVERFMTYAANFIGRKHLKKQVEVHLHGNPDTLHRNLRNMFTNLCKSVHAD